VRRSLIIFVFTALTSVSGAYAQNGHDVFHKWINRALMNPAATGNTNYFEFTTIGRKQWLGVDGAPGLWLIHAQNLYPTVSSGVGLSLTNDYIGLYQALNIKANYAYHLQLGDKTALSFGLAGGLYTQGRDNTRISLVDPYDPEYDPDALRTFRADFDTGLEFRYSDVRIGFSALHFNASTNNNVEYSHCRSLNLYGSIRMYFNSAAAIMPIAYANYANNRFYGEAGAILYIRAPRGSVSLKRLGRVAEDMYDRFWVGGQVSFNGSIAAMAGLFITEQWRLGYTFGYTSNLRVGTRAVTSHEILFSWRIRTSEPRRYLCVEDCE